MPHGFLKQINFQIFKGRYIFWHFQESNHISTSIPCSSPECHVPWSPDWARSRDNVELPNPSRTKAYIGAFPWVFPIVCGDDLGRWITGNYYFSLLCIRNGLGRGLHWNWTLLGRAEPLLEFDWISYCVHVRLGLVRVILCTTCSCHIVRGNVDIYSARHAPIIILWQK